MSKAAVVFTDLGGIQEETTILGIPCMTLRENTDLPITITKGTNRLVKITSEDIVRNYREIIDESTHKKYSIPELWDGKAAERIAIAINNDWLIK